ncbi:MAG: hypothetical protein NVSMB31_09540 [Vulcanimicrobiaceae bacterium]
MAAADDAAAALMAKHKAFMGWQLGDPVLATMKLARDYTEKSGKVTQHVGEARAGLVYRRDYRYQKSALDRSSGFTGNIFWSANPNGFIIPGVGDGARYNLSVDFLFNEALGGFPANLHGTSTVYGKTFPTVHIDMKSGFPIDLTIDPDTGAYVRAVVDPGGDYETTYNIKSYTDVKPNKKYIGSWSVDKDTGVYNYSKIEVGAAVDAQTLHPPATSAKWTFANDQPFKIRADANAIFIDAKINGVNGRFILDTGAAGIVFTDQFADKAHIKDIETGADVGIGGVFKTRVRRADTLEIGGNTLSNVIVDTFNDKFPNKSDYDDVSGYIGFDLLAGALVTVNVGGSTMRIQNPAAATADASAGLAALVDLSSGQPAVPVKINDHFTANLVMDTGDQGSAVVFSSELYNHGLTIATRDYWFGGVDGAEKMRCGQITSVNIGPLIFQDPLGCGSTGFGLHEGLLGWDFLQHFDYVFDYPHSTVVMIPHK